MAEEYVVTIGVSCIDEYYEMDQWIPEGEKGMIHWTDSQVGGMIPNAACVMAGLGKKTYLITVLNASDSGKKIREELSKWNLDLSYSITDDSFPDPKCFIISTSGERTILVQDTSEIHYPVNEKLHEFLLGAKCIYTSMMEFHRLENWEVLAQELTENGVKLVFDVETSTFDDCEDPLFSYASLLFFNEEGWKKFKNGSSDEEAIEALLAKKAEAVVITLGAKGCYCRNRQQETIIPGNLVQVVDTTGAGDTFNCSFTALWLEGEVLQYAAEFANAAGARAVTVHGARGGVASREEIQVFMDACKKIREADKG